MKVTQWHLKEERKKSAAAKDRRTLIVESFGTSRPSMNRQREAVTGGDIYHCQWSWESDLHPSRFQFVWMLKQRELSAF